jgi:hypothetical protein
MYLPAGFPPTDLSPTDLPSADFPRADFRASHISSPACGGSRDWLVSTLVRARFARSRRSSFTVPTLSLADHS